jgi:hypothetical protein
MSTLVHPISIRASYPVAYAPVATSPISNLSQSTSSTSTPASSGSGSDSSVSLSDSGTLLSQLTNLQTAQPEKFQSALTQAATGLAAAAQQAGASTPGGQLLAKSAVTLQQVANTGDVSKLQPSAANRVEQAYGPNQATGSGAVLSLLTGAKQPSGASSAAVTTNSAPADASSHTTLSQAVSGILNDLQQNLTF